MADAMGRAGAVIFAKDMARLAAFYERLLSLARVSADAGHVVLHGGGFELVIHAIPPHIAAQIDIAVPPQRREDSALKLLFPVASLAAARPLAAQLGGLVDPPQREWSARGFTACDGHDPEGNVIQLREPAAASAA